MFHRLIIILAFATFFSIGVFTLRDYGINWDEPIHYIRGQAFLRFFLTGKKDYKDLPRLKSHYPNNDRPPLSLGIEYEDDRFFRRSIYQYDREPYHLSFAYFKNGEGEQGGHPSLNGTIASLFNLIFYQKLGILGDIESYHLFIVFVSSILALVVFLLVSETYGTFAGIIAFLSLTLYPLFFAESHFNIKDPVSASFYGLTLYTFYKGVTKGNWRWIIVSALFAGIALGTKFNIFFAAITVLIWLPVLTFEKLRSFIWPFSKSITLAFILYPFICMGLLFLLWPYLWEKSFERLLTVFTYYKQIGSTLYQPISYTLLGINTYAFSWIFFTTPLVILFLTTVGVLYALKNLFRESKKTAFFILLWFLIPIIRVSLPGTGIYGGVRQIMEFVPAMAMLAGIGAYYIVRLLHGFIVVTLKKFNNRVVEQWNNRILLALQALVILSFIPITLKLISIHPNENAWFNPLIGGLAGAKEKNFADWGTTLGSVYQQGIDWLNEHAEYEAKVALVKGVQSNIPRIKIRKDIKFHEAYFSGKEKRGEYLMEVTDYRWSLDIPLEKRRYIEMLKPVYEVKVDGVSILTIWKNQ